MAIAVLLSGAVAIVAAVALVIIVARAVMAIAIGMVMNSGRNNAVGPTNGNNSVPAFELQP